MAARSSQRLCRRVLAQHVARRQWPPHRLQQPAGCQRSTLGLVLAWALPLVQQTLRQHFSSRAGAAPPRPWDPELDGHFDPRSGISSGRPANFGGIQDVEPAFDPRAELQAEQPATSAPPRSGLSGRQRSELLEMIRGIKRSGGGLSDVHGAPSVDLINRMRQSGRKKDEIDRVTDAQHSLAKAQEYKLFKEEQREMTAEEREADLEKQRRKREIQLALRDFQ